MIDKGRLMAITDGIVAIAATIMALELTVPEQFSLAAVNAQMPTMVAFLLISVQIFLAWHEHHDSFAFAEKINHRIFLLNCLWLLFITLLPFATGLIGQSANHKYSVLVYIALLFLVQLSITIESRAIRKLNKTPILDEEVIKKIRIISFTGYIIAAVCALVVPVSGLIVVLVLSAVEIVFVCLYDIKISKHI